MLFLNCDPFPTSSLKLVIGFPLTVACSFEGVALVTVLNFTPGRGWKDGNEGEHGKGRKREAKERKTQRKKSDLVVGKSKAGGKQCICDDTQSNSTFTRLENSEKKTER